MSGRSAPTPAIAALLAAGVEHVVHEYAHDTDRRGFGAVAAEALGIDASRVLKTLVATTGDELVVGVVPVSGSLDLKALAAALGVKRAAMADPSAAERSSGYVVGAISPIGQRRPLRTVIDESALRWPTVCCSAGRRGLEVELAPADLVAVTEAVVALIAA